MKIWEENILCIWFRPSLIYINNCPTRCNTKQSIYYSASSLYMFRVSTKLTWPRWREITAQKIWPVPEAVVIVLYTPDDGCGWHPKHVEWTCRIINRLLCVASHWTIINILLSDFLKGMIKNNCYWTKYSTEVCTRKLNWMHMHFMPCFIDVLTHWHKCQEL